jgi:hypothetical protein
MLLAVITGVEIVAIYLPFAKWLIVTTLVVLSTVKFLFVIFYFMHLRWDKPFCTILFFIGLVLAGGTMWALLTLFASRPASRFRRRKQSPEPRTFALPARRPAGRLSFCP